MARRTAHATLLTALLLAGCATDSERVPAACLNGAATIEQALGRAPGAVTLADGTPLSTCVDRARGEAELQTLGGTFMMVADDLRARAPTDDGAALRLGYLLGATRRGVAKNPGMAANLGRRLEQATALPRASARARTALQRGRQAGEHGG
jgi:hypothetical protein